MNNKLKTISTLFEGYEIRSIWDSEKKEKFIVEVHFEDGTTKRFEKGVKLHQIFDKDC